MKMADLYERKDGVLIFSSTDGRSSFSPDYSISKAIKLYDNYCDQYADQLRENEDICNWLPELQYFIFQKLIIPQSFYSKFLEKVSGESIRFRYKNNVRIRNLIETDRRMPKNLPLMLFRRLFIKVEFLICFLHNLFIFNKTDILFFDYSLNDYRSKKALADLSECQRVSRTFPSSFAFKCRNFFRRDFFFLTINRHSYPSSQSSQIPFEELLSHISKNWSLESRAYEFALKAKGIKKFVGLDDTLFIFPLLRALSNCNVETIGLQHGVFDKKSIICIHRIYRTYQCSCL